VAGYILAQSTAPPTTVPPKAGPSKAAPAKATAKQASSKSKSTAKAAPPKRYVQLQPTPQRYKEIQQALADRGYFDAPVDGNWGPPSIDALKRFQRDESLDDDGKIGSLSLIRLGLGPQRTALAPALVPAPSPPTAPEPPR
jgi:peptidoglycan hydrolase-like protein with peptidoglycan-binding domain